MPIGTYRVQYELSGFQTIVREDIRVSAGFVARLDIVLKVGTLAETVTVSGISPIIDTSTTAGITSFSKETLETAPTSRAWAEVLAMAPGFRPAGLDIGGDQLSNQRVGIKNYGTSDQITPQIEGINTRQASGSARVLLRLLVARGGADQSGRQRRGSGAAGRRVERARQVGRQ